MPMAKQRHLTPTIAILVLLTAAVGVGAQTRPTGFNAAIADAAVHSLIVLDLVEDGQVFANRVVTDVVATLTNSQKGFLSRARIDTGTFTFKNCSAQRIKRASAGVHTDGFFIAGRPTSTGLVVRWIDCEAVDIDGPSWLFENGSAKRLYFKNCRASWKFEFKLMPGCTIDEIVFDGCDGNISIYNGGGKLNRIYANNHRGAVPGTAIKGLPQDLVPASQPTSKPATQPAPLTLEQRVERLERILRGIGAAIEN
jgi:hypothetical protein